MGPGRFHFKASDRRGGGDRKEKIFKKNKRKTKWLRVCERAFGWLGKQVCITRLGWRRTRFPLLFQLENLIKIQSADDIWNVHGGFADRLYRYYLLSTKTSNRIRFGIDTKMRNAVFFICCYGKVICLRMRARESCCHYSISDAIRRCPMSNSLRPEETKKKK